MHDETHRTPADGTAASWKRYPFALSETDAELAFPAAEGDQGAESNSYYVAGRLRGRRSGRRFAFLVIFAANDVRHRVRADFTTFALFDLDAGRYGTSTELDWPRPLRWRRRHKLTVARGALDVRFESDHGASWWRNARDASGALRPFAYRLELAAEDALGQRMRLALDLETRKPPMPVGGADAAGVKTCFAQTGTHSYFQSDVRFAGGLEWGDLREDVEGDAGWIDRQWAPRYFGVHGDRRSSRYRHEWRAIHLDNGVEMSVWLQVDRARGNRVIPFSGVTAAGPENDVHATTEFGLERLSFVRDPGRVTPLYPLASEARYFADRYRLTVPAWDLELVSEPLVAAPAHRLPVEYWSGPTSITGTMSGSKVEGFGFHERTLFFARDFELVDVLRATVRHLPKDAFPDGSETPTRLAGAVWEIDVFLGRGDPVGALDHLARRVRPALARLRGPDREHALRIADDLADACLRWWVRPPG